MTDNIGMDGLPLDYDRSKLTHRSTPAFSVSTGTPGRGVVTGRMTSDVANFEEVEPCGFIVGRNVDGPFQELVPTCPSVIVHKNPEANTGPVLTLPKHEGEANLTHNPHKSNYQTVEQFFTQLFSLYDDKGEDWVSQLQKAKAYATNELWCLQWYPHTPVGFCVVYAADLDALLAYVRNEGEDKIVSFPL